MTKNILLTNIHRITTKVLLIGLKRGAENELIVLIPPATASNPRNPINSNPHPITEHIPHPKTKTNTGGDKNLKLTIPHNNTNKINQQS